MPQQGPWRPERRQELVGNGKFGGWLELDCLAAWPQQPAPVGGAAKTGIRLINGIGKQPITALEA